jgi:hypothetical protein
LARPLERSPAWVSVMRIGVPGFEPGTSATQRRRATRLRHTPRGSSVGAGSEDAGQTAPFAYAAHSSSVDPTASSTTPVSGTVRAPEG